MMLGDILFSAVGTILPADHGFGLYSASCQRLPFLHERADWALHTISGFPTGDGHIQLKSARCGFRIDLAMLPDLLSLVGQELDILGSPIKIGLPVVAPLVPAARLQARIVTIKNAIEAHDLKSHVEEELKEKGLKADVAIGRRRVVHIHGRAIVGFAVELTGMDADTSLQVQRLGLGGRRRFGCGVFNARQGELVPDFREV
jgi:CRISPR-associated protein Cas6